MKINRPDPSIHRITKVGSQVQTYSRNQKHGSRFAVDARSFGRQLNIQINATASVRRMEGQNFNRLLRSVDKRKTPQILFNRKRRFSRELGRKGTIMGMRNTIATLSISYLVGLCLHIEQ
ncbi:MAG: hypothetical protein EZS28_026050 [Streblomastix strix]|uniref:Uncharacterized protein n=1 Tax=Streblomastix strix TaxID=222440 RepID=A0A5J4V7I2_9EUKA|nr:MAG: hypothetical protein EZS28_026050 [Streblomastix strix]